MRYFLCWFFPPLGLLSIGRPVSAFFNLLVCCTIVGIPFALLWAVLATRDRYADQRNSELVQAVNRSGRRSRRDDEYDD